MRRRELLLTGSATVESKVKHVPEAILFAVLRSGLMTDVEVWAQTPPPLDASARGPQD